MVSFISTKEKKVLPSVEDYSSLHSFCQKFSDSPLANKVHALSNKDPKEFRKLQKCLLEWKKLGYHSSWFAKDPDAVMALFSLRLIYPITGFAKESPSTSPTLRLIAGKIHMMVEGKYLPVVEKVISRFSFTREGGGSLVEKATKAKWCYLGTKGLLPVDRWEHPELVPVMKLDDVRRKALGCFMRVHQQNASEKNCYIQLVTNPRKLCFDDSSITKKLKKNYHKHFPLHAYIRVIDAEGNVYSTGFGSTEQEDRKQQKMGYFSTINGMPTILDYEEFRPHEGRIVTTFAISSDKCEQLLKTIHNDRKQNIRFNIVSQNCNSLAVKYLNVAGVEFAPITMKVKDILFSMLPDIFQRLNEELSLRGLRELKKICRLAIGVFAHLVSILFINPVVIILGGWNKGSAFDENQQASTSLPPLKSGRLLWYENIFEKEVEFSSKTIHEQLNTQEGRTWIYRYKNGPSLGIVPSVAAIRKNKEKQAMKKLSDHLQSAKPLKRCTRWKNQGLQNAAARQKMYGCLFSQRACT